MAEILKLNLEVDGRSGQVRRAFDRSIEKTTFGKAFSRTHDLILNAFPEWKTVLADIFSDQENVFFELQNVPWYLDLIGTEITRTPGSYIMTNKNCKGYQFKALYKSLDNNRRKLLLTPFFHELSPPKGADEKEALYKEETLRGLADTILFLAPTIEAAAKDQIRDIFNWSEVEITFKTDRAPSADDGLESFEIECTPNVHWAPAPTTEGKQCIWLYSEIEEKPKPILVASENFRTAIRDLSEVWHNPSAKSVLLSACSGSGKEELKELLFYALRVDKEQVIELSAPHLASENGQPLTTVYDELRPMIADCKLKKAPVILFFDEIHHDGVEKLRTILLRFMETKYQKIDNEKVDCKGILYLFAASKPPEELRRLSPPDFWTRIEYTIGMKHPLLVNKKDERNEILQQYFCLFWRSAVDDRGKETGRMNHGDVLSDLKQAQLLERLAASFADELDSPLIPIISIRMLRSIVRRLLSRTLYHLRTNEIGKTDMADQIQSKLDEWILEIFKQIVPEIKPEGVF